MRAAPLLALVAVAASAWLPTGLAHGMSEAPSLRPDVLAAWTEPARPAPHTQWTGFLRLAASSNVTAAHYQVCRVGEACFAPPTLAQDIGNHTFRLDTSTYLAAGKPVDYQPGWRLGIVWFLDERQGNGTVVAREFPAGPDLSSPQCQGDAAAGCIEQHYLVLQVASNTRKAPGLGAWGAASVLLAAAFRATARRQ